MPSRIDVFRNLHDEAQLWKPVTYARESTSIPGEIIDDLLALFDAVDEIRSNGSWHHIEGCEYNANYKLECNCGMFKLIEAHAKLKEELE